MRHILIHFLCFAIAQQLTGVAFISVAFAGPAAGYEKSNNAPAQSGIYFFRQINYNDGESVSVKELYDIADKYENRPLRLEDMQRFLDEVTAALIDQGAFLSSATIPPQNFENSHLSVIISEGFISKVQFANPQHQPLQKYFTEALAEHPAQFSTYQKSLLALTRMPGVELESYKQRKDPDTVNGYIVDLRVNVSNYKIFANLTNKGQRSGEAVKAFIGGNIFSQFRKGDVLRAGFITKPAAVEEFKFGTIGYQTPILNGKTELMISGNYSQTKPLSALADRNLAGESTRISFGIRRTLHHDRARRIWVEASLDAVDAKEEEDLSRLYSDKLRVLRTGMGLSYSGKNKSFTNLYLEASQGLDILGADNVVGLEASRPDGEAVFTKLTAELRHNRHLASSVRMRFGTIAQYSDAPLLFSEEFSFGGGDYGRGYDFGEVLGDSGIGAFAELSYFKSGQKFLKEWEVYGFADTGATWNAGEGLSVDGTFLSSAGAGFRLITKQNVNLTYEAAQPLSDAPFTLDDEDLRHRLDLSIQIDR